MQKMTMTIPTTDNKGKSYGPEVRQRIEYALINLFGGFTQIGVRGAWTDSDNNVYTDISRRYEILTGFPHHLKALEDYARRLCTILDQKCILTTCESVQVDFVK